LRLILVHKFPTFTNYHNHHNPLQLKKIFIFDFDSTLTQVEAFEELGEISLKNEPDKKKFLAEIKRITDAGVDGTITFTESLEKRLKLLHAHKEHLDLLVKRLKKKISTSIARNKEFFIQYSDSIYIISCGFKEFIVPIVSVYNIAPDRVYANTFVYDRHGNISGFDKENVLSQPDGKIAQLKSLDLKGDIYVIGDGYSDYQMKEAGIAHKFFAYTENISRSNILHRADHITPNLDEFLYLNKLPASVSYPKNRIKVLLLENIHPQAVEVLTEEGYAVEHVSHGISEDELAERIKNVSILGIRSKTNITEKVLQEANKLLAIGCFCIGTNQVDLEACMRKGVAVFNAPYSNTRSVVELAIGEIIMLMRRIFEASVNMHTGVWNKSSGGSFEIRGKKLGIIGYGNIGSQLSVLAESLGMQVLYYDVIEKLSLGNAHKCDTLKELLKKSDVITVHVDGNEHNSGLIGEKEFRMMKDGVIFLNLSRGFVVDIAALEKGLRSGKIRGAGIDVFPEEPESKQGFISPLRDIPNVILTPHIGGSTDEAQRNIASYVPSRLMDYINSGNSFASVNLPNLQLPEFQKAHRLLHIHENVPGIMAKVNNVFANYNINILGQYLKTNEVIGYMITDINKEYDSEVIKELRKIPNTIRLRVLY